MDRNNKSGASRIPLAERMRPRKLEDFIGQRHLLGRGKTLDLIVKSGFLPSLILWGPPGCGKTTLAYILASIFKYPFHPFSAVTSGIGELKSLFKRLEEEIHNDGEDSRGKVIVFIDEIHRFNKAQQDAFLPYVERGVITLIGTTTLNPSFSIVSPLLSRMKVLILNPLDSRDIVELLKRAIEDRERGYGKYHIHYDDDVLNIIASYSEGDARTALNVLEMLVESEKSKFEESIDKNKSEDSVRLFVDRASPDDRFTHGDIVLSRKTLEELFQGKLPDYDRDGEAHYNLISALHKSIRGSDPDASLYWLARMLEGGEDPLYIARRLIRIASEDIGMADPAALNIAVSAKEAVHFLGMPEGDLALAEAVIYMATAPKSNAVYVAYREARKDAHEYPSSPVPLYLRNPVTSLMRKAGYGKGYLYPHDYPNRVVNQRYFPENMGEREYYKPTSFGFEKNIIKRLEWWKRIREQKD